jgi:hypothetical protein
VLVCGELSVLGEAFRQQPVNSWGAAMRGPLGELSLGGEGVDVRASLSVLRRWVRRVSHGQQV